MYKVLVIGCGGSGAKTLAYMMDQLHADLAAFGIKEIPGCWQFLTVDTPLQEERGRAIGSVTEQGGSYVPCGVTSGYYEVDRALTGQIQKQKPEGLRHLATWMPDHPKDVAFPVNVGAGQFRGIGRLLMLTKISAVSRAVEAALARMASPDSQRQAAEVSERLPGAGSVPDPMASPMVLVVSSMAGGSGASMTLDVCRLVAGASSTPRIDPQNISVFLYTAEAFASVPPDKAAGMPGNTLAMLGEIVAAQAGAGGTAAAGDAELYKLLGLSNRAPRAFKRVTPIGMLAGGTGAKFGDGSTEGVFRGMGRGLARYMASQAFNGYVSYDIANQVSVPNLDLVGWGVDPTDTAWSSFGYASLSTGRDRYAEYAAQRLARRSVDHLLDGFRQSADTSGDTQRLQNLWSFRQVDELTAMGLPSSSGTSIMGGSGAVDQETRAWMLDPAASEVANQNVIGANAREIARSIMAARPQAEGMPVGEWAHNMSAWLLSQESRITLQMEGLALGYARARAEEILSRVLDRVRTDLAELGVPYALHVLTQVRQANGVLPALATRLHTLGSQRPEHPVGLSQRDLAPLLARGKDVLGAAGTEQLVDYVTEKVATTIYQTMVAATAAHLGTALADMATSAIKPLENVLNDVSKTLVAAREDRNAVAGVADVATELYAAWPGEPSPGQSDEDSVPDRFATAHNEVVLMPVAEYPGRFTAHIIEQASQDKRGGFAPAYAEAVGQVVTGLWPQGAGEPAPADVLGVVTPWVPAGLQETAAGQLPTPAAYEVHLSPQDLLRRARAYVDRRGEPFKNFIAQSLRGFLNDSSVGDFERTQRSQKVLAGLERTLNMARPLVQIDPQVFADLHNGATPSLGFTFSTIPFANMEVADDFLTYLTNNTSFDAQLVSDNASNSLSTEDVARVDMFGSYPRTLPVAYSGLLKSVAEAWDQAVGSTGSRKEFWHHRRARPLPGGLPFGDEERRAMVRGWWVAWLVGGIERLPWQQARERSSDAVPIRVWDASQREWVDFPAPMLTPSSRMITPNAALASVLESVLLAYLEVGRIGLEAFRPWKVLREWADDAANGPVVVFGAHGPIETAFGELLGKGSAAGLPGPMVLQGKSEPEERRVALLERCDKALADLDLNYLPGSGKRDEPGHFTNYRKRELVATTPLSIDLAREMHDELTEVRAILASVVPTGTEPTVPVDGDGIEY